MEHKALGHPVADPLLLIVDQWEELYSPASNQRATPRFIGALLDAVANGAMRLVIAVRCESIQQVMDARPLAELMNDAMIYMAPLNWSELGRLIRAPAEKVGLSLDPDLIERILDDSRQGLGQLPLLGYCLMRL